MATMDTIPPEILLKIFSYIFTGIDTNIGAGCTLSLVSRRFHSVAFLIRFETICLKSVDRMRLFLEMLESAPSMPVIRHLLLYDGGLDKGLEVGRVNPIEVCAAIISLAAPTLITLAGDLRTMGFTYGHLPHKGTSFPHLRDFSLGCRNMSPNEIIAAQARFPHMPNLRRLHKFDVLKTEEHLLDINLFTTPKVAPLLTHIRFSNFNLFYTLPHIVNVALSRRESDFESPESPLRLPEKLEILIVQGAFIDKLRYNDSDAEEQCRIIDELKLMAADKYKGVLFVAGWDDYELEFRDCEADWRVIVEGSGDGCWGLVSLGERRESSPEYGMPMCLFWEW